MLDFKTTYYLRSRYFLKTAGQRFIHWIKYNMIKSTVNG